MPILDAAADEAARAFEQQATDYLNASAFRTSALVAAAPDANSTMVAVYPRPDEAAALAQPDGEEAGIIHCTLCYLGGTDESELPAIRDVIAGVAGCFAPLEGIVGGVGAFLPAGDGPAPQIALPDVPGLVEVRVAVTEALHAAGIGYSRDHGFCPHLTIGYSDAGPVPPPESLLGQSVHFDALVLARGDVPTAYPFSGPPAVTAAASDDATVRELARVAEKVASVDYGDTAWNPNTGVVRWVPADYDGQEEYDAAEQAFMAVDGVKSFEPTDAESCLCCDPAEGWELIYGSDCCSEGGLTAAGPPAFGVPAGDEVVDVDKLVKRLRTKTDPVRLAVIETAAKGALNKARIAFDPDNPFVSKVLQQSASQVTEIAATTRLNVMRIISKSYEQGLSIPDTAKAIRAGMKEASGARATLIARTELAGAVNGGSLAAAQIVGEEAGISYQKVWMTAPGARFPRHEEYDDLDGQQAAMDDYFDVGGAQLQFPGDPEGPPEEVCNCRCTMSYTEEAADSAGIDFGGGTGEGGGGGGLDLGGGELGGEVDAEMVDELGGADMADADVFGPIAGDIDFGTDTTVDSAAASEQKAVDAFAHPDVKVLSNDPYTRFLQEDLNKNLSQQRSMYGRIRKGQASKDDLGPLKTRADELRVMIQTPDPLGEIERLRNTDRSIMGKIRRGTVTTEDLIQQRDLRERIKQIRAVVNGRTYEKVQKEVEAAPKKVQEAQAARSAPKYLSADEHVLRAELANLPEKEHIVIGPHSFVVANAEYRAGSTAVWLQDGVLVRRELSATGPDVITAEVARTQEQVGQMLDSLRPSMRGPLHQLSILKGESPANEAFRARNPGFGRIAAQGGRNQMWFWDGTSNFNQSIFDHELGHVVGHYAGPLDEDGWIEARHQDFMFHQEHFGAGRQIQLFGGEHHPVRIGVEEGPTKYGATSLAEDWAESVRLYLADLRGDPMGYTAGTGATSRPLYFHDVFPARFEQLNHFFPAEGPGPDPYL